MVDNNKATTNDNDQKLKIPKFNPNRDPADYDFSSVFVSLYTGEPFLGVISAHVLKIENWNIPTACVRYNPQTNKFIMEYNPEFFASLPHEQVKWVLKHEIYHLIFQHLTDRVISKEISYRAISNIAKDLAINSILPQKHRPSIALMPGVFPENCKNFEAGMLIKSLPTLEATEYYFNILKKFVDKKRKEGCPECNKNKKQQGQKSNQQGQSGQGAQEKNQDQNGDQNQEGEGKQGQNDQDQENGDGNGQGQLCDKHGGKPSENGQGNEFGFGNENGETIDGHPMDEVPEDEQNIMEETIKGMLEEAAKNAQDKRKWGSVPQNIIDHVLDVIKPEINWKAILKAFIGRARSVERETSVKRINKKVPYVFPGVKRKTKQNFVFFIDNSGSVTNSDVSLALGAALECSKEIEIHVYNFDTEVDEESVQVWNRTNKKEWKRTKFGGTSFGCIREFLLRKENKGKWTGAAIVTDGYAEVIQQISGIKFIWLLTPNSTTQYILPGSMVLKMKEEKVPKKL